MAYSSNVVGESYDPVAAVASRAQNLELVGILLSKARFLRGCVERVQCTMSELGLESICARKYRESTYALQKRTVNVINELETCAKMLKTLV